MKTEEFVEEDIKNCKLELHKWSSWWSDALGLARECRICHKTDHLRSSWFSESGKNEWLITISKS